MERFRSDEQRPSDEEARKAVSEFAKMCREVGLTGDGPTSVTRAYRERRKAYLAKRKREDASRKAELN